MFDQFIYTRADGRTAGGGFGFGLQCVTDGIAPVEKGVTTLSYYKNDKFDAQGQKIHILSKRTIPGVSGMVCLSQSVLLNTIQRDTPLTHGYVAPANAPDGWCLDPDGWFGVKFIDTNIVNEGGITLSQTDILPRVRPVSPLRPLAEVLTEAGFTKEQFITAVRGCFDAKNNAVLVMLELDYQQPGAYDLAEQLLRWMYHFLPYAMRREADFTTCLDENTAGGCFTVALVPVSMIVEKGQQMAISCRIPPIIGSGYLFARGRVQHGTTTKYADFDTSDSLYAAWLEQLICCVYDCPEESSDLLDAADNLYAFADDMVKELPPAEQTHTEHYDLAVWLALTQEKVYTGRHIPAAEEALRGRASIKPAMIGTLCQYGGSNLLLSMVQPLALAALNSMLNEELSADWVRSLVLLQQTAGQQPDIENVLTVGLAKALKAAEGAAPNTKLHAAADAYFSLSGLSETDIRRTKLLQTVLFPEKSSKTFGLMRTLGAAPTERTVMLWVFEYFRPVMSKDFTACCAAIESLAAFCAGLNPENAEIMFQQAKKITDTVFPEKLLQDGVNGYAALSALPGRLSEKYDLTSDALNSWLYNLGSIAEGPLEAQCREKNCLENIFMWQDAFAPYMDDPTAREALCSQLMDNEMMRFLQQTDEERTLSLVKVIDRYPRLSESIKAAMDAGVSEKDCETFFGALLKTMRSNPSLFLTKPVRTAFLDTFPLTLEKYLASESVKTVQIFAVLSKFQNAAAQNIKDFNDAVSSCCNDSNKEQLRKESIFFLYPLFLAGSWNDMPLITVDWLFSFANKRQRYDHLAVICEHRGIDALIELINMYPQAEVVEVRGKRLFSREEHECKPRKAAGNWMARDDDFYDALSRLFKSKTGYQKLCADDMAVPKLVQTLCELVPEGAVPGQRDQVINLCRQLQKIWDDAFRNPDSESVRLMKQLKKEKAFG